MPARHFAVFIVISTLLGHGSSLSWYRYWDNVAAQALPNEDLIQMASPRSNNLQFGAFPEDLVLPSFPSPGEYEEREEELETSSSTSPFSTYYSTSSSSVYSTSSSSSLTSSYSSSSSTSSSPTSSSFTSSSPTSSSSSNVQNRECRFWWDEEGTWYRGYANVSKSGFPCQKWTDQYPNQHSNEPEENPYSGLGDHNYCRNPDDDEQPWCYNALGLEPRWEYCDVPLCEQTSSTPSTSTPYPKDTTTESWWFPTFYTTWDWKTETPWNWDTVSPWTLHRDWHRSGEEQGSDGHHDHGDWEHEHSDWEHDQHGRENDSEDGGPDHDDREWDENEWDNDHYGTQHGRSHIPPHSDQKSWQFDDSWKHHDDAHWHVDDANWHMGSWEKPGEFDINSLIPALEMVCGLLATFGKDCDIPDLPLLSTLPGGGKIPGYPGVMPAGAPPMPPPGWQSADRPPPIQEQEEEYLVGTQEVDPWEKAAEKFGKSLPFGGMMAGPFGGSWGSYNSPIDGIFAPNHYGKRDADSAAAHRKKRSADGGEKKRSADGGEKKRPSAGEGEKKRRKRRGATVEDLRKRLAGMGDEERTRVKEEIEDWVRSAAAAKQV